MTDDTRHVHDATAQLAVRRASSPAPTLLSHRYYAGLEDRKFVDMAKAQKKRYEIDFDATPVAPVPNECGVHVIDNYTLDMVLPFIDWNPFFQTWELRGRYPNRGYPKIFDDEHVGKEAKDLFDQAQV